MNRTIILLAMSALALLLLACSSSASGTSSGGDADDEGLLPADSGGLAAGGGGSTAAVDWINFVRFDGVTYFANSHSIDQSNPALSRDVLGQRYAEVRFMVAGNVSDPNYQLKDGDAAFWEKGTPVYEVKGYDPKTLLGAVNDSGRIIIFEADSNPAAQRGSDLLDIQGKVEAVRLLSSEDAVSELARLSNEETATLVEAVSDAPVDQGNTADGELAFFVEFQLNDGIVILRGYFDDGELSRGIRLPDAAQQLIEGAVARR